MPEKKHLRIVLTIFYIFAAVFLFWCVLRFAAFWFLPFILAFATAAALEPVIRALNTRFHFQRGFAAAFCSAFFIIFILGGAVFLLFCAADQIVSFLKSSPELFARIPQAMAGLDRMISRYIASAPVELQNLLNRFLSDFTDKASVLPAAVTEKALGLFSACAAGAPKAVLFLVTYGISVFFMSCGYREIKAFVLRQFPHRFHTRLRDLKSDFVEILLKWIRAQLMLSGISWLELTAAFMLLKLPYPWLIALLIAFVDMLPVLGTGTVLIPWALFELLSGSTHMAIGLIVSYGAVYLVRNCLEPKIVGTQIGLSPIATLMAMYIGFCCAGLVGMICFPITLIMLKQLNDKGYIHLWK